MSGDRNHPSPKQPPSEHRRDWYPYYAGFTEEFVRELLRSHVDEMGAVIDPWNGSGTTTAVCARQRLESAGTDVNPALVVIGRARLAPESVSDSLLPLGAQIVGEARRLRPYVEPDDPLTAWIRPSSVERFRALQAAIHLVLAELPDPMGFSIGTLAEELPILACFYYGALFAVARDLLSRFRATNPTWVRTPKSPRHRIGPGWDAITSGFLGRVHYLSGRLSLRSAPGSGTKTEIRMASATDLPFGSGSFEAAVTSPPYATRIDYVKGVLPELAVLGAKPDDIRDLRKCSTGSPVVKGVPRLDGELHSTYGRSRLLSIAAHPSKGSRTYYYPWMSNYLYGLQSGLSETARVVAPGGAICIVAQDSYYKELHIDLQRIIVDIMAATKRELETRRDYEARNHRARMNPRARRYVKDRRSHESLLVFR